MWREDTFGPGRCRHLRAAGETLADAVQRCLRDKLGVAGIRPHQLHVFDDPDRDDRDWVIPWRTRWSGPTGCAGTGIGIGHPDPSDAGGPAR